MSEKNNLLSLASTNCERIHFSILDLTPEQQKMAIELRRRKQELLLEIQVSPERILYESALMKAIDV